MLIYIILSIIAIVDILDIVLLILINKNMSRELERIKEFKQMYRREMENIESIREDNNDKMNDISKKIDNMNPVLESIMQQRELVEDPHMTPSDDINDEEDIIVTDLNNDEGDLSD